MNDYIRSMRELVGTRCLQVPGVRAIVVNQAGEVLLQFRTDMALWGLPSGSVEVGESALDALRREVIEETDLTIVDAEPMALYSGEGQRWSYPNGDQVQCFTVAFIVRDWSGQPHADGLEGTRVRFFALDDLPADLVPVHEKTLDDFARYNGTFLLC